MLAEKAFMREEDHIYLKHAYEMRVTVVRRDVDAALVVDSVTRQFLVDSPEEIHLPVPVL